MRAGRRSAAWPALLATAALMTGALAAATPALAQQPRRIRTRVTLIAGSDVYVPVGRTAGLVAGDTVGALREDSEVPLGRLLVRSSTTDRAVLTFAGKPFPITRGAVLVLDMRSAADERPPAGAAAGASAVPAADRSGADIAKQSPADAARRGADRPPPAAGAASGRPLRARPGPRLDGRLSLAVEALRNSLRWGPGDTQRAVRDQAIPTLRLRATASGLPGGVQIATNARIAYRHASDESFTTPSSVRFYELMVAKAFERVPVQLRAGRFYSPYESYGGYWDGVLAHYGGRAGLGGGAAFGFAPEQGNERPVTDSPKWSVFVDYRHSGRRLRYETDLSVHREWSTVDGRDDRFVGWSQWIGLDRVRLDHRVQVSRDTAAGTWSVALAEANASLPLVGRLELRLGYALERPRLLWFGDVLQPDVGDPWLPERRERRTVGLSLAGRAGTAGLSLGEVRIADQPTARSWNGYYHLYPGRLDLLLSGSAGYWSDGSTRSLYVAPMLGRTFGPVRTRAGYRYHRTDGVVEALALHGGEITLDAPLPGGARASLTGLHQWSDAQASTRILTGVWISF